ncbi:YeeE/YedE thiosulfate transporter family protein [Cylindrospermopsis raciborskii]|nr:YeeE/YedE thiosulfate transporter family protein [Cylindrospermopsis raciborskii]
MFLGWNPSSSKFWDGDPALSSSVLADTTSIMNLGLILGALLAAGLAGKLIPQTATNPSTLLSKALGGLIPTSNLVTLNNFQLVSPQT